jgi:Transposase
VAVDRDEQPIAKLQVVAHRCQTERLLAWAASFGLERTWAIESATGLGKLLAPQQLLGAGEHVVDVPPPMLSARVRLLGSTKAGKNDSSDALSTAIAGLGHCGLRTVRVEDHTAVIRLLIDRHDGLASLRTQATCRLHAVLGELIAGGAPRPSVGQPSRQAAAQQPSRWSGRHLTTECNAHSLDEERGQPSDHRRRGRRALPPRVHEQRVRRHPASGRGRLHPAGRDAARPAAVGRGRARGRGCPPGRPVHRREATPTSPTLPARLL